MSWTAYQGSCLDILKLLPDKSYDSIVTDPPYGLREIPVDLLTKTLGEWLGGNRAFIPKGKGFMGKSWDEFVPPPAAFDEMFRVLKPGGYIMCFAGTKTVDLMGLSIRLAGFEVRDSLDWIYGTGFPKSLDVSKAIDKAAGVEREVIGIHHRHGGGKLKSDSMAGELGTASELPETAPATAAAKQWEGWGTALKPAHEPIILARKPLAEKTVAANVLEYNTGGLNIDGCRIAGDVPSTVQGQSSNQDTIYGPDQRDQKVFIPNDAGRWPPNVILSDESAEEMDKQSGTSQSVKSKRGNGTGSGHHGSGADWDTERGFSDSGGASRFFPVFKYQAKAPTRERPVVELDGRKIAHTTIKPLALMRWCARLITPPGGKVLDPFAGSGTTGEAAELEGFDCLMIERDSDYMTLIEQRMGRRHNSGGTSNA